MTEDLRPPYRQQFDNARDPYTARNALGITDSGAGFITSVSAPLAVTSGNLTIDLATSPGGRLTLQTATPVMTTTQSAKTTIYYTPYVGNKVPIYDGTSMAPTTFSELSVATTDTTKSPAAIGASKVNDWFVWSDAGTIRIGHGPDWTSDIARSAGTALVMVNGVLLNNASITNGPAASRGTYVGTTRSNASSQLDWIFGAAAVGGTAGFFGVYNCYNKVGVACIIQDTTANWTYASSTWRQARASAGMQTTYVSGLGDEPVEATYANSGTIGSSGSARNGIGLDSTTVPTLIQSWGGPAGAVTLTTPVVSSYAGNPGIGVHVLAALEVSPASVSITYYGPTSGFLTKFRM